MSPLEDRRYLVYECLPGLQVPFHILPGAQPLYEGDISLLTLILLGGGGGQSGQLFFNGYVFKFNCLKRKKICKDVPLLFIILNPAACIEILTSPMTMNICNLTAYMFLGFNTLQGGPNITAYLYTASD